MKFKSLLFLLPCFLFLNSKAQTGGSNDKAFTYEAGISVGPMNSLTDIGGRNGKGKTGPKDLNIKSTTLFGSLYASVIYKHFLAVRIEATAGSVKSKDSLLKTLNINKGAIGRYSRNLSFQSPIKEISLTMELHPLEIIRGIESEGFPLTFSPYCIGGFGYFHFNPRANLNGQWIDLKPLHTEGEGFAEFPGRKEYKLNQFNIPMGIGINYELSPSFNFRLEYINRLLFTDYLDDVHDTYINPSLFSKYLTGTDLENALILNNRRRPNTPDNETTARPGGRRGNPLNNDSYFTINFKIGYRFGSDNSSGRGGRSFGSENSNRMSDRKLSKIRKNQRECPRMF